MRCQIRRRIVLADGHVTPQHRGLLFVAMAQVFTITSSYAFCLVRSTLGISRAEISRRREDPSRQGQTRRETGTQSRGSDNGSDSRATESGGGMTLRDMTVFLRGDHVYARSVAVAPRSRSSPSRNPLLLN